MANKRDKLEIYMVSDDVKNKLRAIAEKQYGTDNISSVVRLLISDLINKEDNFNKSVVFSEDTKSIELTLPVSVINLIDELAENRLSTRNHYIAALLYGHLGNKQLQGDEIEVLRKSNYELSKIGSNLNQIAKALNMISNHGDGKVPNMSNKMSALSTEIKDHTKKVLSVLEVGTVTWGGKVRGGKKRE